MTPLRDYLNYAVTRLKAAGVDSPRLSAELLTAHAMGVSREDLIKTLILFPNTPLEPEALDAARSLIARREAGEPASYLIGRKEFYGREFAVNAATLIPRPDTETLIDAALGFAKEYRPAMPPPFSFADLGTGSGCIAVTLALELGPSWRGRAVDISPEALAVARNNAARLNAANLDFAQGDFTRPLFAPASLDLVAANPPYVGEEEYAGLSREVRDFEPKTALVPPAEEGIAAAGPEHEIILLHRAAEVLRPGGLLLMECGCTQGDVLLRATEETNAGTWRNTRILPDLAGLPRVLYAIKS